MDLIKPFSAIKFRNNFDAAYENVLALLDKKSSTINILLNSETYFSKEKNPALYVYHYQDDELTTTGLIGLISLENVLNKKIFKHEEVYPDKVEQQKELFLLSLSQINPVLIAHESKKSIRNLLKEVLSTKEADIIKIYNNQSVHKIWTIHDIKLQERLKKLYNSITKIYIADGHHRIAALEEIYIKNLIHNQNFLAYLVSETEIKIEGYAKIYKKIINYNQILVEIERRFDLKKNKDQNYIDCFVGYIWLQNEWYLIKPRKFSTAENNDFEFNILEIINNWNIIETMLSKHNNCSSVYNLYGKTLFELEDHLGENASDMAFYFKPLQLTDIHGFLDKNRLFPPNTTWIKPKLPDFLLNYLFSYNLNYMDT